jgi:hypothetical protein
MRAEAPSGEVSWRIGGGRIRSLKGQGAYASGIHSKENPQRSSVGGCIGLMNRIYRILANLTRLRYIRALSRTATNNCIVYTEKTRAG